MTMVKSDEKFDIEGNPIKNKLFKKKKGREWKEKLITQTLENKLPNEFKGYIANYNHLSSGWGANLDDKQYCC